MPKKISLTASPHHVLLYDEDYRYLQVQFGPHGYHPVGVSTVIRAIIHQKVMALRASEAEAYRAAAQPIGVAGGIAHTPVEPPLIIED